MSSHDLHSSSSNGALPSDSRLFSASARPGANATFCAVNAANPVPNPSILWRPRAVDADYHAGSGAAQPGGRRKVVRPPLLIQRGHPSVETTAMAATASSAAADPTGEASTAAAPVSGSASTKRGLGATGLDRGKHELLRVGKRQRQRFPPPSRTTAVGAVDNVGASLPSLRFKAPRPPSPMAAERKMAKHQTAPREGWRPDKIRADGTGEGEGGSSSFSTSERVAGRESEREEDGCGRNGRPQSLTPAWQTVEGRSFLASSSTSLSSLVGSAGAVPPAAQKRRGREISSAEKLPDTATEPISGQGCAVFGTAAKVALPHPEISTAAAAFSPITSRIPLSSVIGGRNIADVQGPCSPSRPGTCITSNSSNSNTSSRSNPRSSSTGSTSRSRGTSPNSNIASSSSSITSVQRGNVGNNGQTDAERKGRNLFDAESVAATATTPAGGKGEQQQQQQQKKLHQSAHTSLCPALQRDWSKQQALKSAQISGLAARRRLAEATAARRAVHEKLQACRSSLLQPATRELQRTQQAAQEHRANHLSTANKGARRAREAARAAEHACVAARRRARDAKGEHQAARTALLFPALLSEWYEYAAMLEAERRTRAETTGAVRTAEGAWRRVGEARAAVTRADEASRKKADKQAFLDNRLATAKHTYSTAREKCESLVSHLAAAGQREKAARAAYEAAKAHFVEVRAEVFAVAARLDRVHGVSGISVAQRLTEEKGEEGGVACTAAAVDRARDGSDGGSARGGSGGAGGKGGNERAVEGISSSTMAAGTKRAASAMGQAGVAGKTDQKGQEEEGRAKKRTNVHSSG